MCKFLFTCICISLNDALLSGNLSIVLMCRPYIKLIEIYIFHITQINHGELHSWVFNLTACVSFRVENNS